MLNILHILNFSFYVYKFEKYTSFIGTKNATKKFQEVLSGYQEKIPAVNVRNVMYVHTQGFAVSDELLLAS